MGQKPCTYCEAEDAVELPQFHIDDNVSIIGIESTVNLNISIKVFFLLRNKVTFKYYCNRAELSLLTAELSFFFFLFLNSP